MSQMKCRYLLDYMAKVHLWPNTNK